MGFFSWITKEGKSICNKYSNYRTFEVHMVSPKEIDGKLVWTEDDYDGYGVFGGKDYYVLLAEINDLGGKDDDEKRSKAIDAYYDKERCKSLLYPILTENPNYKRGFSYADRNESCEGQGYWYDEAEADEYGLEWEPYVSPSEKSAKDEFTKKIKSNGGTLEMALSLPKIAGKKPVKKRLKLQLYQIEKIVEDEKWFSYQDLLDQIN